MTLIQVYRNKVSLAEISNAVSEFLMTKINNNQEVFESLARMGSHYGGSILPDRFHTAGHRTAITDLPPGSPPPRAVEEPEHASHLNRYSVVYLLKEQYKHLGCSTHEQAQEALKALQDDAARTPVGIYDDRTELFEWDAALRDEYEKASMRDQGRTGEDVIRIAQALRRRDSSWDSREFRRPSFFA